MEDHIKNNNAAIAHFIVTVEGANKRLDEYAAEVLPELTSRKAAYKAVKRGDLRINGEVSVPNYKLQTGYLLELLPDSRAKHPVYHFPLNVI